MNTMMLLEMAAAANPERVGVGDADAGLSYGELFDAAARAATWLRAQGTERVAWIDVSSPVLAVAVFASGWAGQPFVPLNYRLADERLAALAVAQAPATVLCGADTPARLGPLAGLELVNTAELGELTARTQPAGADWSNDAGEVAVLLHTSGTSGDPKVAVLRHRHLVSYVLNTVEFASADDDEATLVSVPPYHVAGVAALLSAVYAARRVVQLATFSPEAWITTAQAQRVTHAMLVPTMLARIVDVLAANAESDPHPLPALRHLSYGGGRMPLPVIEHAMALLPQVEFVNAYGLTETSSTITLLGPADHRAAATSGDETVRRRLGSVGRPLPGVEIQVRDADRQPVPDGVPGEIWVRGEQVSGEYAAAGPSTDRWFATRDGGWLDADGYLYVDGRVDDVIVRGGENLSPGEIEDVLLVHPAVADAAVVGLPDKEWGEIACACVVLRTGVPATEEELRNWVTHRLRSSRTPSSIQFRESLPYTDSGKVLRRVLRDELMRSQSS